MPGSQLKEKMFKCLGQGHKTRKKTEKRTLVVNYQYIKETKIHTLQNSIISILTYPDFFNAEIVELSGLSLSSKILVNWSQLIAGILVDTHNIKQI